MKKTAHVYRFNDRVAVYLGNGAALKACAADIAKCNFSSSQMGTLDFELSEN